MSSNSVGVSEHKRFSPSSSKTWINCPASIVYIAMLPDDHVDRGDTIHSRRGTAAHGIGELSLASKGNMTPYDYVGMEIEGVIIDEDLARGAQIHVDYCKPLIDDAEHFYIEHRSNPDQFLWDNQDPMSDVVIPPGNNGGTGDFIAWNITDRWLEVVDYKNGKGFVDHVDNTQMLIYALGTLVDIGAWYDQSMISEVLMTISQPNVLGEEALRTHSMTTEEVFEWGRTIYVPAVEEAYEIERKVLREGEDIIQFLRPGEAQCAWCDVRHVCPKAYSYQLGGVMIDTNEEFGDLIDAEPTYPEVETLTEKQIEMILQHADNFINYVKSVQDHAARINESRGPSFGRKLIAKYGHRKYSDGKELAAQKALKRLGLSPADYLVEPKLKSPSQLEQVLKCKGVAPERVAKFLEEHVTKPEIGTKLVPFDHKGEAVNIKLEDQYADLIDDGDFDDLMSDDLLDF